MKFLYDNDVKLMFKYTAIYGIISEASIFGLLVIVLLQGSTFANIILLFAISAIILILIRLL